MHENASTDKIILKIILHKLTVQLESEFFRNYRQLYRIFATTSLHRCNEAEL